MKKREQKALKPSEMGLHSKVRWEINISGDTPKEHAKNIALFAEEFYLFLHRYNYGKEPESVVVTQKFADLSARYLTCWTILMMKSLSSLTDLMMLFANNVPNC